MPALAITCVALYLRLSKKRNAEDGVSESIARQEKAGRALIAKRYGDVAVKLYVDDNRSAWRGPRPGWDEMLEDIAAGTVQVMVTYHLDRLYRQPRDLEKLFDICDAAGLTEMATCEGMVDLATSDGRLVARMLGNVAVKSSDDTSRRLKDMWESRAADGKPGGGQRAFGWADKMTPDPTEAPIVREMVGRFLAGDSLTNLARDLNARGIPTTWTRNHQEKVDAGVIDPKTGEPHKPRPPKWWASSSVRAVLTNPRHAGIRELRRRPGRKMTGPTEVLVTAPATWGAIISRADHERVLSMLNDPSRRHANPPRRSMLTGLARCGTCGNNLTRADNGAGYSRMRCQRTTQKPEVCGKLAVSGTKLEHVVKVQLFDALDRPDLARALSGATDTDDDTAAELAGVEDRLNALTDMFAMGEIDRAALIRGRKRLEGQQAALRASLSRQRRTSALDGFLGQPGALRAAWDDLPMDRQRAILAAVIDRIVVAPATNRGAFHVGRITMIWRV